MCLLLSSKNKYHRLGHESWFATGRQPSDKEKALDYWRKGFQQDEPKSMFMLAVCYEAGVCDLPSSRDIVGWLIGESVPYLIEAAGSEDAVMSYLGLK